MELEVSQLVQSISVFGKKADLLLDHLFLQCTIRLEKNQPNNIQRTDSHQELSLWKDKDVCVCVCVLLWLHE